MESLSTDTSQIREWQSIVTLIAFFLANVAVLFPFHIPLPIPRILWNAILGALVKLRIIPQRQQSQQSQADASPNHHEAGGFFRLTPVPVNMITAPLIADLFLLATLSIGRPEVRNGILGANGIDPVDVMLFFLTLAYIALSLDASGLIRHLACRVLRASRSGRRLYFYLYGFFFALTTCIGNDPIILSGTPFLAYITRVSNIEHPGAAWIYSQFAVANIASAILVSSNPTNLVLTAAFGIRFIDYTANVIMPVLFTVVLLFPFLLFVVFRDRSFIPRTIEMQKLERPEGEGRDEEASPVNPNIPYAAHLGDDQQGLREVLNPYLDKKSAIFAALIMAATLITVLALNASTGGEVPVYWVTLPAAVVMFGWDVIFGWLNRHETRELARRGRREAERAEVAQDIVAERRREREREEQLQSEKSEQLPRRRQAPVVSPTSAELEPSSDTDEIRPAPTPPVPQPSSDDEKSSADTDLERQVSHHLQPRHSRQQPPDPTTLTSLLRDAQAWSRATFPTATTVLSLLPFPLVPFAFAMFVLVEALVTKGWVPVFAYGWHHWVNKTGTVGAVGGMGFVSVVLCNFSGTNIGTTILLCRILQTWRQLHLDAGTPISDRTFWAAVYSAALGVNYGAFSAAFSASLAGLLWRDILAKKGILLKRTEFLRANVPIVSVATAVGLAVLVGEVYLVRGEQPYVLRE
ncbi:uncharacterized protein PG986_008500 [Apiospora aurea]|uniref:Citrate transporter-like domain-containing protein n=1 Tax=Apiospora aurea TaxID=335848 RepID=A0ABR1QFV7_9PEZI